MALAASCVLVGQQRQPAAFDDFENVAFDRGGSRRCFGAARGQSDRPRAGGDDDEEQTRRMAGDDPAVE